LRRWLLEATDLSRLSELKPLANDDSFREIFLASTREAKGRFAHWLKPTSGKSRIRHSEYGHRGRHNPAGALLFVHPLLRPQRIEAE
jgi:hypothetical protein